MSPTIIGVGLGLLFTIPAISVFRARGFEGWAWPLFLATLPIYYMLFGLLALDGRAIMLEFAYGLPFIICGLIVWKIRSRPAVLILGIAWLGHGLYDYFHDLLFINPGVFAWYPAFCAVVDILVGCYLLAQSARMSATQHTVKQ